MQDLKVTIIQSALEWENPTANLATFEEKIWTIEGGTDIIVLPEMFSTGFSMYPEKLAEPMNFNTFKWMKQMAAQTKAVVTGSVIIKEGGKNFNRLIWMQPDGNYQIYDKKHLFGLAGEGKSYSEGPERIICEWKGWRICPLICYDLRFPVWSRNKLVGDTDMLDFDLLIYVASWPAPRVNAWDTLLKARAIENLSYCVGVNRIGIDENNYEYIGHSGVYSPKGETLAFLEDQDKLQTVTLSGETLSTYRQKFPFHKDADDFEIKI